MNGTVMYNTLRSSWKQALYWGLGLGILGFYFVFIASSSEILEGYANLFKSMPPAVLAAFGVSDLQLMSTVEGWIVTLYVSEAVLILSIYAVMAGANIVANEEQAGIMDIVLALPLSRAQYIIERWIAYALISLGIILLCILLPLLAIVLLGLDADIGKVTTSIFNIYPSLLLITTVTSLLTTILRRRTVAVGLAAVFVIGSYVFNTIGASASGALAALLQNLSFFHYMNGEAIILDTFNPLATIGMFGVVLVGFALSVVMFNRRDIGL